MGWHEQLAIEAFDKRAGLDTESEKPVKMLKRGVVEPLRIKTQALNFAAEKAVKILRMEDVIASKSCGPDSIQALFTFQIAVCFSDSF